MYVTGIYNIDTLVLHFIYARDKLILCEFVKTGLWMRSSTLCIVTYGMIKIYAIQIYVTEH